MAKVAWTKLILFIVVVVIFICCVLWYLHANWNHLQDRMKILEESCFSKLSRDQVNMIEQRIRQENMETIKALQDYQYEQLLVFSQQQQTYVHDYMTDEMSKYREEIQRHQQVHDFFHRRKTLFIQPESQDLGPEKDTQTGETGETGETAETAETQEQGQEEEKKIEQPENEGIISGEESPSSFAGFLLPPSQSSACEDTFSVHSFKEEEVFPEEKEEYLFTNEVFEL